MTWWWPLRRFLLAVVLSQCAWTVHAHPDYVARIPNGDNVPGVAALGHINVAGGGERNDFGQAFANHGLAWTTALCQADSDGDGQTNGQELGDPCCVWTIRAEPVYSDGVSAPGDAASMADPALWANVTCANINTSRDPSPKPTDAVASTTVGDTNTIARLWKTKTPATGVFVGAADQALQDER